MASITSRITASMGWVGYLRSRANKVKHRTEGPPRMPEGECENELVESNWLGVGTCGEPLIHTIGGFIVSATISCSVRTLLYRRSGLVRLPSTGIQSTP
jgi:hypothetical protein